MRSVKNVLLVLALTLGLSLVAQADPIYTGTIQLTDCGTAGTNCPAATYSFTIGANSASLTVQNDGPVTAGVNNMIGGVNLGFTSKTLNGLTGSAKNDLTNTFLSGWNFTTGSLNNNGCGSNGDPAVCAAYSNA